MSNENQSLNSIDAGNVRKNASISNQERERIITASENGMTAAKIAELFSYKRTSILAILKNFRTDGRIAKKDKGGNRESILNEEQRSTIKAWVDDDCTVSLKKLKEKILNEFNLNVSISTIFRTLESFHYSLKNLHKIPVRRNDEQNILARNLYSLNFTAKLSQLSEERFIFIDEVGFNVSMRISKGRSLKGTPAVQVVPTIRSKNISVICAMNKNRILSYKSHSRPINAETFTSYVQELLATIESLNFEKVVFVMNNVKFYHSNIVKNVIEVSGHEILYLPPYSPFLNPIENMFSKWKNICKRSNPNNETDLLNCICNGSEQITLSDCEGYYRNMWSYLTRCLSNEIIQD